MIRPPVRMSPYFSWKSGKSDKSVPQSRSAKRKREHELFEEISMRYKREAGKKAWVRPDLLACGKCGCVRCTCNKPLTLVPLSTGRPREALPSRFFQTLNSLSPNTGDGGLRCVGKTSAHLPKCFWVFGGKRTFRERNCRSSRLFVARKIIPLLDLVVSSGTRHTRWDRRHLGARVEGNRRCITYFHCEYTSARARVENRPTGNISVLSLCPGRRSVWNFIIG